MIPGRGVERQKSQALTCRAYSFVGVAELFLKVKVLIIKY
jgi:hypothetical protein